MWNNPRPIRTETISVDTARLARHAVAQLGYFVIEATPIARGKRTKLITRSIADMKGKASLRYYVFKRDYEAIWVLREILEWDRRASKTDGGILMEAPPDHAEVRLFEAIDLRGLRDSMVSGSDIERHVADVRMELDRNLLRLQSTGAMGSLNREYKQLRARPIAEGEKGVPSYSVWVTKQLETRLLHMIPTMAASLRA